MNCQKLEEVVNDIAREQLMDVGLREQAMAHTRECVQCERRLADELALTSRLRGFASVIGSIDVPETLTVGLLAEFDRRPSMRRRRVEINRGWWIAVAATLLLVIGALGAMGLRWRRLIPAPVDNAVVTNRQVQPEKEPEPRPDGALLGPNTPVRRPMRQVRKAARRQSVADSTSSAETMSHHSREIATDFFLINYSAVTLAEGGRVIRVSLPRSAMARFGLPVNMDRANEPVKADLILGIDNLPQAIRFVQELASADGPNSRQSPAQSDARKTRKEKKS